MSTLKEDIYETLKELGIAYTVIDHEPYDSFEDGLIAIPGVQVKNLFIRSKEGDFYLVLLPPEKHADLGALSERLMESRLKFASDKELKRLLGVKPGATTVLGVKFDLDNEVQILVDTDLDRTQDIGVHPCENDATVMMSFEAMQRYVEHFGHKIRFVRIEG